MSFPPIEIRVDELLLREFQPEDAEAIFALIDRNRDHLSQFGDDTAKKYPTFDSVAQSIINPPKPEKLRFGIWNGSLVGSINLYPNVSEAQIGYYLGAEFQGNGYMTRSFKALIQFASDEGFEHAIAYAHEYNHRSIAVLLRAGMKFDCVQDNKHFFCKPLNGYRLP